MTTPDHGQVTAAIEGIRQDATVWTGLATQVDTMAATARSLTLSPFEFSGLAHLAGCDFAPGHGARPGWRRPVGSWACLSTCMTPSKTEPSLVRGRIGASRPLLPGVRPRRVRRARRGTRRQVLPPRHSPIPDGRAPNCHAREALPGP
jgi:hypothetical protein